MPAQNLVGRRHFLKVTGLVGVAGTSLLVGCSLSAQQAIKPAIGLATPLQATREPNTPVPAPSAMVAVAPTTAAGGEPFIPNAWLRIDPDNTITITVARSEMGQGVHTALPMLVAEDLEADWTTISVEQAPADGTKYGDQSTGGSASVMQAFYPLRRAGATAREMLISAAAQTWNVERGECHAENGSVIHPSSGRSLRYGELVTVAATIEPPSMSDVPLKEPAAFRFVGKRLARLDAPAKVAGTAIFGLDVRLPGMLYAVVARCPVFGGKVVSFDAEKATTMPGVRHVVEVPGGIAVVADTTWAALKGREALSINWDEGPGAMTDSAGIRAALHDAVEQRAASMPLTLPPKATTTIEAVYELAYQAHATMEPMNCTADVRAGHCEVWAPTQAPQMAALMAAQESGVSSSDVVLHVTLMGGGFGRRLSSDFVAEAVQVSKAVSAPVQVVWTREDDMAHDQYRPASYHRLDAGIDAVGTPVSWRHIFAAQTSGDNPENGANPPYAVPGKRTALPMNDVGVPTGPWRSVSFAHNVFAVECFIDEVAVASGTDPLTLRRDLLRRDPRLKAVLDLAAEKAGWDASLPAGRGRGIAACSYEKTRVAQVAEVEVAADGTIKVLRVVCAIDCGLVVNPGIVEAQIEGAIIFGLTSTLKSEITVAGGRVEQHNFDTYPLLRINETPDIEVHFMSGGDTPFGTGEPGVPPLAPAIANAIFAATGKRVRRLPIRPEDLRTSQV